MELNAAAIEALGRATPAGGRYRLTIRRRDGGLEVLRTADPAAAAGAYENPDASELRIEAEADGGWAVLIPYFRVDRPAGAVDAPVEQDPRGLPVRIRVYDPAAKVWTADVAGYGAALPLPPDAIPQGGVVRVRDYRWSPEERRWTAAGEMRELALGSAGLEPRSSARSAGVVSLYDQLRDALLQDTRADESTARLLGNRPADEAEGHYGAQRTIYQVLRGDPRKSYAARLIHRMGKRQGPAGPLQEMGAYLQFYSAFNSWARGTDRVTMPANELAPLAPELLALADEAEAACPSAGAVLVNRAKVLSLTDREAAAETLAAARAASPLFLDHLKWDEGLHTYLRAAEVGREPPAYDLAAAAPRLRAALAARAPAYAEPQAELVWSMDARFLRAHGPQWFDLAPALIANYRLGMTVLLVGDEAETGPLVEEARDLIARTARFHGATAPEDVARSVAFVRLDLPELAVSPVTFYASARYLHAGQILAETGRPVVILDADWTPSVPFDALLRRAAREDVCLPISRGHAALSPWRRYLAGCAYFNATPGAARFLDETARYLLHGLTARHSWMLDQNALCWAMERCAGELRFIPLEHGIRPGGQDPFRKANEQPI